MRKTSKVAILVVIVAILLLGIGYAALQNITLNIGGTVTADPSQANFNVIFTGTPEVSDLTKVTAEIDEADKTKATIDVQGLEKLGETVTAIYEIENASENLSTDLTIATTNSNIEYFEIESKLEKTSLIKKETTTATITVKLIKEPIEDSVEATVNVEIEAVPVQPGEEGKTGVVNGPTTLASVKNNNIGQYIDLGGTSYVGDSNSTSDDWRIFYADESNQVVYAILADYLPARYIPEIEGLVTDVDNYPYGVWSETDAYTLVNGLNHETAWDSLVSIEGAEVTGSPTKTLFENSLDKKYGTTDFFEVEPTADKYNLYVTHYSTNGESYENCLGYWLAHCGDGMYVYQIINNTYTANDYNWKDLAARPVVSLPFSTPATVDGELWTVGN